MIVLQNSRGNKRSVVSLSLSTNFVLCLIDAQHLVLCIQYSALRGMIFQPSLAFLFASSLNMGYMAIVPYYILISMWPANCGRSKRIKLMQSVSDPFFLEDVSGWFFSHPLETAQLKRKIIIPQPTIAQEARVTCHFSKNIITLLR